MAVAELSTVQKPVVFIPYPFAAEDHQTANALNLVKNGAACMVKDSEAKDKAIPMVIELIGDENRKDQLKRNIKKFAVLNADEQIAKEILKSI
jgi:UDP-N-acetylglucosamine--N-acetylmuramyl-(pentapeptide) pyrophosphoryl-undecaprenol N-acetylglucosamine transferase